MSTHSATRRRVTAATAWSVPGRAVWPPTLAELLHRRPDLAGIGLADVARELVSA